MICVQCVCVRSGLGGKWGWVRGLGLGFTIPVGTGGVWDVCLCLGCGGVGSVGKWVGWLRQRLRGCSGLMSVCVIWIICVDVYGSLYRM